MAAPPKVKNRNSVARQESVSMGFGSTACDQLPATNSSTTELMRRHYKSSRLRNPLRAAHIAFQLLTIRQDRAEPLSCRGQSRPTARERMLSISARVATDRRFGISRTCAFRWKSPRPLHFGIHLKQQRLFYPMRVNGEAICRRRSPPK